MSDDEDLAALDSDDDPTDITDITDYDAVLSQVLSEAIKSACEEQPLVAANYVCVVDVRYLDGGDDVLLVSSKMPDFIRTALVERAVELIQPDMTVDWLAEDDDD